MYIEKYAHRNIYIQKKIHTEIDIYINNIVLNINIKMEVKINWLPFFSVQAIL